MNCPKCSAKMETVTFADVEVDRCTQCHGLWFDASEAEKLRSVPGAEAIDQAAPAQAAAGGSAGAVSCPRCHTRMIEMVVHGQPHIRFESCTVCYGQFYDAGEFTDLKTLTLAEWWKAKLRH